jgi:uncharacterized membrane protein
MIKTLQAFALMAIFMFLIDAAWLTFRADFHVRLIKAVQGSAPELRLLPAALIYILIPATLYYFVVSPARTASESMKNGAILGFSLYGLYDLTNLASLKGWTIEMAITDTLWGTVLCALGSVAGFGLKSI